VKPRQPGWSGGPWLDHETNRLAMVPIPADLRFLCKKRGDLEDEREAHDLLSHRERFLFAGRGQDKCVRSNGTMVG